MASTKFIVDGKVVDKQGRPAPSAFPTLTELQRRQAELRAAPIKLGLIARTIQAEMDRDLYAERLRDIATMAQADTDPFMEMQARAALHALNAPLLDPKKKVSVFATEAK